MGISKLIAGTVDPFAIAAQRAFLFNISMIKVMARVACSAGASLAKRDKNGLGLMGTMCQWRVWRMLFSLLPKRFVGDGILKLEVNSPEGE